jgi:hypothetical protein
MPSEPSLRRLGVGGGGGGDRPLRAQFVVAVVVVLVIVAVPVYLLRRPSGKENAPADAGSSADALSASSLGGTGTPGAAPDAGTDDERVKLGAVVRVKCSSGRRAPGQEGTLCDRLDGIEEAFVKGIRDNVDCAPKIAKGGSINFVLTVDFTDRRVHVFPGASGSWKGPSARKAADCVKKAIPVPDWTTQKHQYRYYMLAVLATYPSAAAKAAAPAAPVGPAPSAGAPLFD